MRMVIFDPPKRDPSSQWPHFQVNEESFSRDNSLLSIHLLGSYIWGLHLNAWQVDQKFRMGQDRDDVHREDASHFRLALQCSHVYNATW